MQHFQYADINEMWGRGTKFTLATFMSDMFQRDKFLKSNSTKLLKFNLVKLPWLLKDPAVPADLSA